MSCIFCDIVNGIIPAKIICENKYAIAFLDVSPIVDGHTLVIPKKHFKDLNSCDKEYLNGVMELVQTASNILYDSNLKPFGMNYLSNQESIAGQVVMHFHMHIIPRYQKNELSLFKKAEWLKTRPVNDIYEIITKTK